MWEGDRYTLELNGISWMFIVSVSGYCSLFRKELGENNMVLNAVDLKSCLQCAWQYYNLPDMIPITIKDLQSI